jgi:hypothetical protein
MCFLSRDENQGDDTDKWNIHKSLRFLYGGLWRGIVLWINIEVSEEHATSISLT